MSGMRRDLSILADHLHLLPEQARQIAALIGIQPALKLVERLGGTTFPVAKRANKAGELRFSVLEDVVGLKAAEALTAHYGGTRLYIPNCKDALRRVRNTAMIREFDQRIGGGEVGRDVVFDLALRYGLADRVVWGILKGTPEPTTPKQYSLL